MIYINIFNITPDNQSIQVSVETKEGFNITSAKLWSHKTYKNETEAIDLSFKLEQINHKEVFLISTDDASVNNFSGIFFLELESNHPNEDCSNCPNPMIAVTANFNSIKTCMLDKILELSVCGDVFSDSGCNGNPGVSIVNINLLLEAMCTALGFGYYNEAIDIYNTLIKLCGVDDSCPDCPKCNSCDNIEDPTVFSGLGYGTLGNTLILT